MLYQTHFMGGMAAGAATALFLHVPPSAALPVMLVSGVAALAPDVDHGGSLPNRLLGLGGRVVSAVVPHRTMTHSLAFCAAVTFGLLALHTPHMYVLAAVVGVLSHLVLDSLNPHGVPWLWPLGKHFSTAPLVFAAGSFGENMVVRPAMYLAVFLCVARFLGFNFNF
ncbi:metal-dependent hydrolase [Desulfofundulus thermobenzoicus]|uniref:Metal-dependent hydrolase n=1 Tax=Desulfofundulus thermobenzoicus TaxID=29376 RepID=A0A6N7IPE0_9FIRM|nr:metal-dependent hydrolase [Desulfofundulus thermobenzoicus]MQL51830.1 metal-dependent hydrolase [Desulfofundulus thermobenzoicus]